MTLDDVLLPNSIAPKRYTLKIVPDLEKFDFSGHVSIELDVNVRTSSIKLHALQLTIDPASVKLSSASGDKPSLTGVHYDLPTQTVSLHFDADLAPGLATLSCAFRGVLNDELAGFYRSKYTLRGETKYMAVTQFEATDAVS